MNTKKRWMMFVLALLLLCTVSFAFAETARVVTPKGPLNMRKKTDEKSTLVESVPNRSLVEVEETDGEWSKITYKKKTGYVKTEYLKLSSQLPGMTVYADGGTLLLRNEPDASAAMIAPVSCLRPVTILTVSGDWAQVQAGDIQGWTEAAQFSFQFAEPAGEPDWMPEHARVESACCLLAEPKKGAESIASLEPGQEGTVTVISGDYVLLLTDKGCGYAPVRSLSLTGPEDSAERLEGISPNEAAAGAETALRKKFKAFAKTKMYWTVQPEENAFGAGIPAYACGFFNDADQYLYGAMIDAETGKALFLADYSGFAVQKKAFALLPSGEMSVSLSNEQLSVGDVLDISVLAWTDHECAYLLKKDGVQTAKSEPGDHFQASFRPRQTGNYTLTVTVKDETGLEKTESADFTVSTGFTVDEAASSDQDVQRIYSQKDGWWKDKKYRHSNLEKSGCAIFTLSGALARMGHTENDILPENLAVKYAYCLIPNEGTSNELLINTAARDFGFKTRKTLYTDKKQILQLIEDGAFFTFSIARGHIALVIGASEDGTMIRVADSAPKATFERIVNAAQYYQTRSGAFRAALTLDDLPGARWYFETDEYGGLEYFLPIDYVAKRGVRLIQPLDE